jgi:hypothetical protein
MTVRLDLKLGALAESDRLPESPDTVVTVQPTLGSTVRTKGSLFVLATGPWGRKNREFTRMAAEKIRDEYYYDESAGIVVCLQKAVRAASRRLLAGPERLVTVPGEPGPIGLAIVVVRAQELYVATVGPAEAYLLRQASLLTLPDRDPSGGLPNENGADPPVWRGEIAPGDSLLLVAASVTSRVGLGRIQDFIGELHPQAAVEQIRRELGGATAAAPAASADAEGGPDSAAAAAADSAESPGLGDGMLVIEAAEATTSHRLQPLKPVWPNDTRAGSPERAPIPVVDSVGDGVAAVAGSARQLQRNAGDLARGAVYGLFDRMPHRRLLPGRVLPPSAQLEGRRRIAYAAIGLLLVFAVVGTTVAVLANGRQDDPVTRIQQGQSAYDQIQSNLDRLFGDRRDMLTTDPDQAGVLLKESYSLLTVAKQNGYKDEELAESKAKILAGLNRYYHVLVVDPAIVLSFDRDELTAMVRGPDGCAYVLDRTADTLYRVDLAARTRAPVFFKGMDVSASKVGTPLLLATAAQDVLLLDDSNTMWKWRPAISDTTGKGVQTKVRIDDSVNWGGEIRGFAAWITKPELGLYAVYIVDPTAQQILKYTASGDGSSGYRGAALLWLTNGRDVSNVNDILVDGSLYLSTKGSVLRFDSGSENKRWSLKAPPDTILRPQPPGYTRIAMDDVLHPDEGRLYAYDSLNHRVVAFRKDNGTYIEQYVVPSTSGQMSALKGMFVVPGVNGGSATLYWIDAGNLLSASLNPATTPIVLSPSPSLSPSPAGSSSSAKASPSTR